MSGLVYDAGALIGAERRASQVWALHDEALAAGVAPVVPAVVLGQAWRGGPQALLSRLLTGCVVESFDENAGRAVGRLLRDANTSDVVDAHVVLTALRYRSAVLTSDAGELRPLVQAASAYARS
ncbi:MAG: twitching motility protein PilT [Actinomycetota bacterium]|nr:twitching motility protein PilT [Actinomycetota bacterium]